jgi:hypothetical protein
VAAGRGGGDGTVTFEPIGPVPLKGVAGPVPLHPAARTGKERST